MRPSVSLIESSCATSESISRTLEFENDLSSKVLLIVPDDKYIESPYSSFEQLIESETDFNNKALPQFDILEWKEEAIKCGSFEIKEYIEIGKQINRKYLEYDGFVIFDNIMTIPYTASFLSFMFENLAKPIVLTSSHSNKMRQIFSDAKSNLLHSLMVAAYTNINEVIVCFNKKIFRGNRIQTIDQLSQDPFITYNYPKLGEIAATQLWLTKHCKIYTVRKSFKTFTKLFQNIIVIHLTPHLTDHMLKMLLFHQLPKRKKHTSLNTSPNLSPKLNRVQSIKVKTPRRNSLLVLSSVKGVIISLYGVGNAPSRQSLKDVLKQALNEYECEIVITCQSFKGGVDTTVYDSGNFLSDLGLITAADMTTQCCVAKLSYLLGKGFRRKQLKEQFETNLRGEMTEMSEKRRRVVQHIPMDHIVASDIEKNINTI